MAEPTGRAKCAPDDKLRDTHLFSFAKMMGFAKELNPHYATPSLRISQDRLQQSRKPSVDVGLANDVAVFDTFF